MKVTLYVSELSLILMSSPTGPTSLGQIISIYNPTDTGASVSDPPLHTVIQTGKVPTESDYTRLVGVIISHVEDTGAGSLCGFKRLSPWARASRRLLGSQSGLDASASQRRFSGTKRSTKRTRSTVLPPFPTTRRT